MKFIELTYTDETPTMINFDKVITFYPATWTEKIPDKIFDPLDGRYHDYPKRVKHEYTEVVYEDGSKWRIKELYPTVKRLLEGAEE